jgi:hypothetical protein
LRCVRLLSTSIVLITRVGFPRGAREGEMIYGRIVKDIDKLKVRYLYPSHSLCNTIFITSRINNLEVKYRRLNTPTHLHPSSPHLLPRPQPRKTPSPRAHPDTLPVPVWLPIPFLVQICVGIHIQIRIIPIPPLRRTRRRVLRHRPTVPAPDPI